MGIASLIFDLGNVLVLYDVEEVRRVFVRENPEREYLPWGDQKWAEFADYERGRLTTDEFIAHIQVRIGRELAEGEFQSVWEKVYRLNEPLARLLPDLSRRYPLVLLSNIGPVHWDVCRSQFADALSYFKWVLSFQMGLLKPDRNLFVAAASAAGCRVESCLFIDDLDEHVVAAHSAGLQSLKYTGDDTIEKLRALI